MGIEPTPSAWKAEVLPLNYTRRTELPPYSAVRTPFFVQTFQLACTGGGGRIRTSEAYAADLQSAPFDRSGTPPAGKPNIIRRK